MPFVKRKRIETEDITRKKKFSFIEVRQMLQKLGITVEDRTIIINDGTNDRILIGKDEGGF